MRDNNLNKIIEALEVFVSGKDRSFEHANLLNGLIIENFYEDERFEELMEVLATYRPEGGEYLYDEKQALTYCKSVLEKLKLNKKV